MRRHWSACRRQGSASAGKAEGAARCGAAGAVRPPPSPPSQVQDRGAGSARREDLFGPCCVRHARRGSKAPGAAGMHWRRAEGQGGGRPSAGCVASETTAVDSVGLGIGPALHPVNLSVHAAPMRSSTPCCSAGARDPSRAEALHPLDSAVFLVAPHELGHAIYGLDALREVGFRCAAVRLAWAAAAWWPLASWARK